MPLVLLATLRQTLRTLLRSPGFTLSSVLMLALGIGISTTVFSVVNGVVLQPLRFHDSERIVTLATLAKNRKNLTPRVTGGDYVDLRDANLPFAAMSYYQGGEMGVQLRDSAEFTGIYLVNPGYFQVFEFQTAQGRFFGNNEAAGAVVGAAFALRHFGDASRAIGERLSVENKAYQIVGVIAGPRFPEKAEVWLPASPTPENLNKSAFNYYAVARLNRGVSLEHAQAKLTQIGAGRDNRFFLKPLREQLVGPVQTTLFLLFGAVILVLFISCANVSNLLLARATGRSREMAIRAAMGASRVRIIGQLLLESTIMALMGGGLGLLFSMWGTRLLVRMAPASLPRAAEVHLDWTVMLFGLGISLVSALIFGLAPAWQASRVDIGDAIKQGGTRGVLGAGSQSFRGALVVAEIALAFVLASGAGLLFRSMMALNAADLGYRPEKMLVLYAHAPANTLDEYVATGRLFVDRILPDLAKIPGVESSAAAMGLPGGTYGSNGSFAVVGKHQMVQGAVLPEAGFRLSSPAYFSTMRVPLLKGRDFTARDQYTEPFVAIVSQALVKQVFEPGENPIGRQIICGLDSLKPMTIVGVVGDVRSDSPGVAPHPELYMPLEQHPYHANELQVIVRTSVEPGSVTPAVRSVVYGLNPGIAMKFTTLETMVSESVAAPRFRTFLIGAFAAMALLLAMAGTYGVMNYLVSQRTSELGLRIALGAGSGDVLRLVIGRAWVLASLGLAIGGLLSIASGRALSSMLFGLAPSDPATYAVVLLLVAVIATLAAFGPAWRASHIDPMMALRKE